MDGEGRGSQRQGDQETRARVDVGQGGQGAQSQSAGSTRKTRGQGRGGPSTRKMQRAMREWTVIRKDKEASVG